MVVRFHVATGRRLVNAACALLIGCSSEAATQLPTEPGNGDASAAPAPDSGTVSDGGTNDGTPLASFDPGPAPKTRLQPVVDELTIIQLHLVGGLTAKIGEAAIIVGPNGTMVLVDAGNSSHDDDVRNAVEALNTEVLTPAHGFPARAPLQVDWIVLTHFHADHMGSLANLLGGAQPLTVTGGVVHRGYVDVGDAVNEADYEALCTALRGPLKAKDVALCSGPVLSPCSAAQFTSNYVATNCDGLLRGDLGRSDDDGAKTPSFIDLGKGARLELLAANGWVLTGSTATARAPFGHDATNEENARSIAAIVRHGAFRYHFAGDMTGSGDTNEPDVESHLVTGAAAVYGSLGVDVTHANHHARQTSSNDTFVAKLAPADGRARNVVAGINSAYLKSPYEEVLTAWGDANRLGAGSFWITDSALAGASHPKLVNASGDVIVQTMQKGDGYWVQAASSLRAEAYPSVRRGL